MQTISFLYRAFNYYPRLRLDLPSTFSLLQVPSTKPCIYVPFLPYVPHSLPISLSLIWSLLFGEELLVMQHSSATCHKAHSYWCEILSQNLTGAPESTVNNLRHFWGDTQTQKLQNTAGVKMSVLMRSLLSFWSENDYTNAFSSIILECKCLY